MVKVQLSAENEGLRFYFWTTKRLKIKKLYSEFFFGGENYRNVKES
jgi:hypothetical protein